MTNEEIKQIEQMLKQIQKPPAGLWEWAKRLSSLLPLILVLGSLYVFMRDRDVTRATMSMEVSRLVEQQKLTNETLHLAVAESKEARKDIVDSAAESHRQLWDAKVNKDVFQTYVNATEKQLDNIQTDVTEIKKTVREIIKQ